MAPEGRGGSVKGRPSTFWGKLQTDEQGAVIAWHPLLDHCADVAACGEALLSVPVIERRLARLAGRAGLDAITRARLAVLIALHDVGKYNHGFQRKAEGSRGTAGHVVEALALLDNRHPLCAALYAALDVSSMARWVTHPKVLFRLLSASIAHHGRPHDLTQCGADPRLWSDGSRDAFGGIRALVEAARRWFPMAWEDGPPLPDAPAFDHAFSGLVTLADWLGSDRGDHAFPYTRDGAWEPSGARRMAFARERAAKAVAAIGLDPAEARETLGPAPGFDRISAHDPRPAQRIVLELPVTPGGSTTVLEAETGSGKTEAALARFARLFAAGEVDGLYFALPTRTAATQLHRRVLEAVARAWAHAPDARPPVALAVPGYLRVDGAEGRRLPGFEVLWNDRREARWRFRGWAAEHPKRFLAGSVVVGTIDQVLLSALRVDHAHLRATSLLRHLLVVDEVHASDAYMARLLETVLARHRAAGGHAILLSATLGGEARARLLSPEARRRAMPSASEARSAPYPVVTHADADGIATLPVEHQGRRRVIEAEIWPVMDDAEAIARRALEAAEAGARVLVLRNTVAGCVAVQVALEAIAGPTSSHVFRCEGRPAPHHARFARDDRARLDAAVERDFGRERAGRGGVVAVATQTVEQSLDLDADLMLTDLCPMDVLLQRVGRLHRHDRPASARPEGFRSPRVVVIAPAGRDLAATVDPRKEGRGQAGHGLGSVYRDLRVIEATWRELERDAILRVPDGCRARVEAAVHSTALDAITASDPRWAPHAQFIAGETLAKGTTARQNLFGWDKPFGHAQGLFPEKGEGRPPTRLGDDDRLFDFAEPPLGPFGGRIAQLKVPGFLAEGIGADPDVTVGARRADGFDGFDFTVDGTSWVYDRHGVRQA